MGTLAVSSEIFSHLFGTDAMREIFSDRTLVQRYLDSAYAGIVDENTLKISYYYRRTSR